MSEERKRTRPRCHTCDRPKATKSDWRNARAGDKVCYARNARDCDGSCDWRKRSLKAEALALALFTGTPLTGEMRRHIERIQKRLLGEDE